MGQALAAPPKDVLGFNEPWCAPLRPLAPPGSEHLHLGSRRDSQRLLYPHQNVSAAEGAAAGVEGGMSQGLPGQFGPQLQRSAPQVGPWSLEGSVAPWSGAA